MLNINLIMQSQLIHCGILLLVLKGIKHKDENANTLVT